MSLSTNDSNLTKIINFPRKSQINHRLTSFDLWIAYFPFFNHQIKANILISIFMIRNLNYIDKIIHFVFNLNRRSSIHKLIAKIIIMIICLAYLGKCIVSILTIISTFRIISFNPIFLLIFLYQHINRLIKLINY